MRRRGADSYFLETLCGLRAAFGRHDDDDAWQAWQIEKRSECAQRVR